MRNMKQEEALPTLHVILASYLTKEKLLALDKRKYFSVPPNPGT